MSIYKWTTGLPTWTILQKRQSQWSIISMICVTMAVSLLKNMQVSSPKKVKKTVGWFIPRRHHLAGLLLVGTTIGVGLLLPMLGWCRTSMTTTNSPRMKPISKKRFIQCSRRQPSSGTPSYTTTRPVTVGFLLHLTRQSMVLSRSEIPSTNL